MAKSAAERKRLRVLKWTKIAEKLGVDTRRGSTYTPKYKKKPKFSKTQ